MIELGAGFGRWLVNGALAARQRDLEPTLIGVEAEPTHYAWLLQHFSDNALDPQDHRLLHAAVSKKDGKALFQTGKPGDYYGQKLVRKPRNVFGWALLGGRVTRVRTVTLRALLDQIERVDLLDLDIEGMEADVLASASDDLDEKVARIHIGTHSVEGEERTRRMFSSRGWLNAWDFPCEQTSETPFGEVRFQNGVQGWLNPRLVDEA